jgi:hypothetical protein
MTPVQFGVHESRALFIEIIATQKAIKRWLLRVAAPGEMS